MKRTLVATATTAAITALSVLSFAGPSHAAGIDSLKISAEGEAYALRIEYDVPLPAGTGSIPYVIGEARRSPAGENAKGQAGAPSQMDLVVGGTVAKPHDKAQSLPEPYPTANRLPQTECFYPGALVDTKTLYPTDARPEVAPVPPFASAASQCSAGPTAELHARSASTGVPGTAASAFGPVVQTGAGAADGLMRPLEGVVHSDVAARVEGVNILNGVVKIGAVIADSSSSTKGAKGTATSLARIAVHDIEAAGQRFSLNTDKLTVGTTTIPLVSAQADSFFATLNVALKPQGCNLSALATPSRYPQGFVFQRPQPKLTVEADGTYAASMRAGLLLECDIPESVTGNTTFSPQRMQMVVGFAFSAVEAIEQPGGFGLASLGTPFPATVIDGGPLTFTAPLVSTVAGATFGAPGVAGLSPATPPAVARTPTVVRPSTRTIATFHPFATNTRTAMLLVGILLFAALTHVGITRLRRVFGA